jgi:hypothetical protein
LMTRANDPNFSLVCVADLKLLMSVNLVLYRLLIYALFNSGQVYYSMLFMTLYVI